LSFLAAPPKSASGEDGEVTKTKSEKKKIIHEQMKTTKKEKMGEATAPSATSRSEYSPRPILPVPAPPNPL
jgi:hypothetical protein